MASSALRRAPDTGRQIPSTATSTGPSRRTRITHPPNHHVVGLFRIPVSRLNVAMARAFVSRRDRSATAAPSQGGLTASPGHAVARRKDPDKMYVDTSKYRPATRSVLRLIPMLVVGLVAFASITGVVVTPAAGAVKATGTGGGTAATVNLRDAATY